MTVWRWRNNLNAYKYFAFPQPYRIGNRLYFERAEVVEWLDRHRDEVEHLGDVDPPEGWQPSQLDRGRKGRKRRPFEDAS
jgi:hypothetical protein